MQNFGRTQATRAALLAGVFFTFGLAVNLGACGGKVVIDQGEGGASGTGSSSSSASNSSTTGSTGSFTGSTGAGTDPPPPMCARCGEFMPHGGDPSVLCDDSWQLYAALNKCICAQSCIPQCTDNICSGKGPSDACFGCAKGKCENELTKCLNDI